MFLISYNKHETWILADFAPPPFPQINIVGAVVIDWRVRGKTIRSVLCNMCATIVHSAMHTYERT